MKKLLFCISFYCLLGNLTAQEIKFTITDNAWDADSLGNHRVLATFNGEGNVAKLVIPCRRRDDHPENKKIIVEDAQSGKVVLNVVAKNISQASGDIYFEPVSGKGIYYIYYMPYKNEGRANYPKGVYLQPEETASAGWLSGIHYDMPPNTTVSEIQSINAFNSNFPMEVTATEKETDELIQKNKSKAIIVFPEDRTYPVRMRTKIPYRWVEKGPSLSFSGKADRGEHYSFQLAIFALKNTKEIAITFSDLKNEKGKIIASKNISCLNTTGVQYDGTPFSQKPSLENGHVQSLWCLVEIPTSATAGKYKGNAVIKSKSHPSVTVSLTIDVSGKVLSDGGISTPELQTRLHWLNSTMAQENTVIAPYTPLKVNKRGIDLLGRRMYVGDNGFPLQILSFFNSEMTGYNTSPSRIFTGPVQFNITKQGASNAMAWKNKGLQFVKKEPGTVSWKAENYNTDLKQEVNATLEFDGFIMYTVKLIAQNDINLKDIAMILPFTKNASKYMMGLGQKGGYRPATFEWKWDVAHKNQDGAWIGNVNMGLQYSLRDEKYVRPLNTNFYLQKPLLLPASWGNDNKEVLIFMKKTIASM